MQKSINPFRASKDRGTNQKIALTGVFFGLVILMQWLEQFMPFGDTYLKLNFSLLFILPIFYFAGPAFGITVLFLRFAIGPSVSSLGYSLEGLIGHFILFISTTCAIVFMYIYSLLFAKINNHNLKTIYISIATVLSTSLVLTLFNGLFFTPLYWWVFGYVKTAFVSKEVTSVYSYVKYMFFGIPTYWGGIFAVYLSGNLVKFGLIYIVFYPMSKVLRNFLIQK